MKLAWMFTGVGIVLVLGSCKPDRPEGNPAAQDAAFAFTDSLRGVSRLDIAEAPITRNGVALGKVLFFDEGLSADGKVSCGSCHKPEKAFSDPARVSTGVFGAQGTRQSMALVNLAYQSHLFWDGRSTQMEEMLTHPMERPDEMGLTPSQIEGKLQTDAYKQLFSNAFKGSQPSYGLARKALSQYVRTLVSANSKYDKYLAGAYQPTAEELAGMRLFFTHPDPTVRPAGLRGANCGDCHMSITTAGRTQGLAGFANNGFLNPTDFGLEQVTGDTNHRGKFRIPSLRNIALTAPYMHDGRFATLEQVLDHYNSPEAFNGRYTDFLIKTAKNSRGGTSLGLTDQEKRQVIAFLHMLTDTTHAKP